MSYRFFLIGVVLSLLIGCGGGSIGTGILPPSIGTNTLIEEGGSSSSKVFLRVDLDGDLLRFSAANAADERLVFTSYRIERRGCSPESPWEIFKSGSTGFSSVRISIEREGWCQYRVVVPATESTHLRQEVVVVDLE